jgi:pantetheine-phosphate adenylyltransferase
MKTALFPGSFDPFTRGHEAVVREGLEIFDRVVIGIGSNSEKHGLLTIGNRARLVMDLYEGEPRVEVAVYEGLTCGFCREAGIKFLLRGMRNAVDFEYERNMMTVNRMLFPEITTVLLFTPPELAAVSSSMIRELLRFGGDPTEMMPAGIDIKDYIESA